MGLKARMVTQFDLRQSNGCRYLCDCHTECSEGNIDFFYALGDH